MNEKQLGKDAKEVAIHFMKLTEQRITPAIMGKTIKQTKSLLEAGFTKREIIEVMDYVIHVKRVEVWSVGYFSACINDALRELKEIQEAEQRAERLDELNRQREEALANQTNEVTTNDESAQRNRDKAKQFGAQSRKRTKFNLDMFERQ